MPALICSSSSQIKLTKGNRREFESIFQGNFSQSRWLNRFVFVHFLELPSRVNWTNLIWWQFQFSHVQRCRDNSVVKICRDIVVEGQQRKGRPRKTWYQVMDSDLRSLKIDCDLAQNWTEWKIAIKKPI